MPGGSLTCQQILCRCCTLVTCQIRPPQGIPAGVSCCLACFPVLHLLQPRPRFKGLLCSCGLGCRSSLGRCLSPVRRGSAVVHGSRQLRWVHARGPAAARLLQQRDSTSAPDRGRCKGVHGMPNRKVHTHCPACSPGARDRPPASQPVSQTADQASYQAGKEAARQAARVVAAMEGALAGVQVHA